MPIQLVIGPEAITSYRRLAYTPWHAIAELVDNSTQSYFDNRSGLDRQFKTDGENHLTVSVAYDRTAGLLRVADNAMGMSREELELALHVARPPADTSGRSKYGMGLKTAACWLGNRWTITTKKLGEREEHRVTVDVEKVANASEDALIHKSRPKPEHLHYTIVEVVEMNRAFQGRTLGKIGEFLCSMYRADLRAGLLQLRWRDRVLKWEPVETKLLRGRNGEVYKKEFEFEVEDKVVRGWVGILDRGSRAEAGFSILQADRVVKGWPDAWRPSCLYGQWQGSNDLINQRLVGEVHLDGFEVSHTKDNILWRGSQEEAVESGLKEHCAGYRDFAKKRRKKKPSDDGPSEVDIKAALEELEKELQSPEMVDQINIRTLPSAETIDANNEKLIESVVSTRRATAQGSIAASPEIRWQIFLEGMSPYDPYVVSDSTKPTEIVVIVNTSHPYWCGQIQGAENVRGYLHHCVYDSIAEWQARARASTVDPDTAKILKDQLLRVALKIEEHEIDSEASDGVD